MARYTTQNITFTSVGAGATSTQSVALTLATSTINIYKVKVVPSVSGGNQTFKIYTKNTFSPTDLTYILTGSGIIFDPALYDGSTYTEAKVGFLLPYEDEDATNKIHVSITNGDSQSKDFTVTIVYEAA